MSILRLFQSLLAQKLPHFLPLFDIEMVLRQGLRCGGVCNIRQTSLRFKIRRQAGIHILRRQRQAQIRAALGTGVCAGIFLLKPLRRLSRFSMCYWASDRVRTSRRSRWLRKRFRAEHSQQGQTETPLQSFHGFNITRPCHTGLTLLSLIGCASLQNM